VVDAMGVMKAARLLEATEVHRLLETRLLEGVEGEMNDGGTGLSKMLVLEDDMAVGALLNPPWVVEM